ncbi:MAG: D-tyrosyl-tRNA(Tyr) deacylase [Desulfosarcina sp.]|nr:D-tyrosyl-tRNA(Tyr) deacylase [Desulfobacterales bacterium]
MRAVVQRVKSSEITVAAESVGRIAAGLMVLLGVATDDEARDADYLAAKIAHLRIFEDDAGKMNRSLVECGGEMLVVPQFTLQGDCRKGRRPSFAKAASPARAEHLYERFIDQVRQLGLPVQTGRFGAMMEVALVNHGPVTLVVDSR